MLRALASTNRSRIEITLGPVWKMETAHFGASWSSCLFTVQLFLCLSYFIAPSIVVLFVSSDSTALSFHVKLSYAIMI